MRLLGCRCPSGGRLFLFLTRRARRAADALRDGPGVPSRDARPPAPRPAFRRAWLWKTSCSIFYPLVTPRPQTCGCAATTHLFGSKARPPPARRTHAHGAAHAVVHRRPRRVACGLPSLPPPAPSPCLTSCTPRKVRRAVWRTHTHTVGCPALVAGGEAASTAATARVRHALFASRHPLRHAHTHTQPRSCTWPTPCAAHPTSRAACTRSGRASHPRVSLRVPALHSAFQPPVHPTSDQPRRSRTAHCTALALHCGLQLVAHGLPMTHTGWLSRSSTASHAPNGL